MIKKIVAGISSVAAAGMAFIANAGMMDRRDYGMMGGDGIGFGGLGFVNWISLVLVWTALVLAIMALLRWLKKNP